MRKSKVLKALLVFGMSVATATSVAAMAGCGHTHTYDENEWGKDASKHWRIATCEEHPGEKFDEADHVDKNNDKKCDVCGGDISSESENPNPGPDNPDPTPGEHTHTWSTTFDADHADANGHWHWCTAGDDCDETDIKNGEAAHVDANSDNVCDECGFVGNMVDGYKALAEKAGATNVLSNTFFAQTVDKLDNFTGFGTKGLYGLTTGNVADNYVTIHSGVAEQKSTGKANGGANVGLVADLGSTLTGCIVEGYVEFNASAMGNDWAVLAFYSGNNCDDANRVFAIASADKTGKLSYFLNDKTQKQDPEVAGTITASALHNVYYKFDLTSGKVTVTFDGKAVVTGLQTNITSLSGYQLVSSNSGDRLLTIDNLITVTTEVSLDEYKQTMNTKVAELETAANLLKVENAWTLTDTTEGTEAKIAAAKMAVSSAIFDTAATKESIDVAYATYETAVVSALKAEYKARLVVAFPAGDYDRDQTTSEAYTARLGEANGIIDAVSSVSGFTLAYTAACEKFDDLENDNLAQIGDVVITISDGMNTVGTYTGKANVVVKVADVQAKVNIPLGKTLVGLYSDVGMVTALSDANLTISNPANNFTLTVYAKFEDKTLTNQDFKATGAFTAVTGDTQAQEAIWYAKGVSGEANKKTAGGVECPIRIKTNGTFAFADGVASYAIKFNIEGAAKITVYALSGNSSNPRDLVLYDAEGQATTQKTTIDGKNMTTAVYNIAETDLGTYYLGSANSGINIYRIVIEYGVE